MRRTAWSRISPCSPVRNHLCALALLLASVLLTVPAGAQDNPNLARGFESGKQYDTGSVDSVNLFTGGLSLTLPIGSSYPVNGSLAFSLSLVYHSNVWDYQIRRDSFGNAFIQASPRESANSGLGWHLSLGRLYPPQTPGNIASKWVYMSPDGGRHLFFPTLHNGEAATAGVCYSRDDSYLRLAGVGDCALNGSSLAAEIESPEGRIYRFTRASTLVPFQIVQVRDRFNNQVNVDYSVANQWTITDGHRMQRVFFVTRPSGMTVVDRVELASFNGGTATYTFNYQDRSIARSCKDNDTTTSASLTVSLLASITMPEGLSYSMLDASGANPAYNTTCDSSNKDLPGTIQRLTLPTLGSIEWTYTQVRFVDSLATLGPLEDQLTFGYGTGVSTKTVKEPSGACYGGGASCTWTYLSQGSGQAPFERKVTVTSPLGDATVFYFDEDPDRHLFNGWQYGLPFKKSVSDGAGHFLSQEIYSGSVATGTRKRAVYVRYDKDQLPFPNSAENFHNTNRRLESQRIVYDDDPGRYADLDYSSFDGLGHYRTATTGGNFGAGDVRTTFTGFNPDASGLYPLYKVDAASNTFAAGHNFVMPGAGSPWVLGNFAEQTVSEGGATAKNEYCFDPNTGFLLRKRILVAGTARGGTDVLVNLTPSADGRGNLATEEWFGGDGQILPTTALCGLTPPANVYRLNYLYQFGALSSTQYQGFSFKTLERVIDANTGLIRQSLDTAQLATDLEYDRLGRLTWEKPTAGHGAWVNHVYLPATGAALAQVNVSAYPNGTIGGLPALSASQIRFDRFGRVTQDRIAIPGGGASFSTRETKFNALGWKTSVSELGSTASVTTFLSFDPFGRPATVRPPEGAAHDVSFTYTGSRSVSRTVKIGTAWNGTVVTESPATTTETYDRQGRLWQVAEPAGGTSATYAYNVLGLLSSVAQTGAVTQTRLFNYDNRGFLLSERHPEKGAAGNGTVSYFSFDPRGLPARRVDGPNDVSFVYDRAERLTKVYKTGTPTLCTDPAAHCLKVFTYADSNAAGNSRKGKLAQSDRYNYPALGGVTHTVVVSDLYTYGGRDGRASQKETRLTYDGTTNEIFPQSYVYDDIGQVTSLGYPNCAFAACASSPRTVTFGYNNGWLNSVPGYANSISYYSNGLLNQVTHANGVVFTQVNDPNGIPRPASMASVSGATTPWMSGVYTYDGTGSVTTIGGQRFLYDAVGRVVEGQTPDGQYQKYTYDAFGNITSTNTTGTVVNTPTSASTNHLNAPSAYDGAGNLIAYNGSAYELDELNLMKHVTSGAEEWLYMYDANDDRFWSFKVGANPRVDRFSLRDLNGRLLREYANSGYTWGGFEDYIHRGDRLLTSVLSSGAQRHFDLDHLGSVRLVTDGAGAALGFHRFFPYGKENTALQEGEKMKFTGHERDLGNLAGDGDDLDYMHARYYSPLTARFLSMDRAGANPRQPQSWNRYAYAMGNPIKYTDPRGLLPEDPIASFAEEITVVDGKPGTQSTGLIFVSWAYPRPGAFVMTGGRGENLTHDQFVQAVAQGVWQRTAWLSEAADRGAEAFDFLTGYVSAADALMNGDPSQAAIAGIFALIPGPLDNAGYALVRTGTNITEHAAQRMAQREISQAMVDMALRKGKRFWDPKNKSVAYVLEEGFASGKSLLVGRNPVTGQVTTVIRGTDLIRPRMVPLP